MLDLRKNYKDRRIFIVVLALVIALVSVSVYAYDKNNNYKLVMENQYNMAFFELIDYVKNVQNYLAKSLISSTPEHGAETLTQVWREANLASAFLSQLPISTEELSKTEKFLNQVSDYSYALSRKNIYNESLKDEDFKNLKELHTYSVDLENVLNQLATDFQSGNIKWSDINAETMAFAQEVSNMSSDSFTSIEQNFEKYEGLIYDGAFSEHMTKAERVGLTGDDIDEETAKNKIYEFLDKNNIEEITNNGLIENGNIQSYDFTVKNKDNKDNVTNISISKKGGHVVFINRNRDVNVENLNYEQAGQKGKEYLSNCGYENMEETYYLKQSGILTINYAYKQDDVIIYPDLIKVKVALDNGEILGLESTGYLNSHQERTLKTPKITIEEAKKNLNPELEILSEGKAIIPTEWKTELECYEFKGKVDDTNFLVYINIENGREESILVIVDTPNGTLTI